MLDSPSKILLEVVEPEYVAVNQAAIECLLYQKLQITYAQCRYGALPADPDVALALWPNIYESIAEEPACHCSIEFTSQGHHGKGFAHARSNEFIGTRVQDDVVERSRVAVEHRRHDAMARRGDPIAEDPV